MAKDQMALQSNFKAVDSSGSIRAKTVIVNITGASERDYGDGRYMESSKNCQTDASKAAPSARPSGTMSKSKQQKKKPAANNRNSWVKVTSSPQASSTSPVFKSATLPTIGIQKKQNNKGNQMQDSASGQSNAQSTPTQKQVAVKNQNRGSNKAPNQLGYKPKTGKVGQNGNFSRKDEVGCIVS